MTTQLTTTGWSNGTEGTWSKRKDRVLDLRKGIELSSRFKTNTMAGDDVIAGAALRQSGLSVIGRLKTEADADRIRGDSQAKAGILNEGTIDTGRENDTIIGISRDSRGLENQGTIYMQDGIDLITGWSRNQEGITNSGYIDMGSGNDTIRGRGVLAGLRNDEYISMGSGSDIVDVRRGGFAGTGWLEMDSGFDKVFGFGSQTLDGGGDRDSLYLNQGRYRIRDNTDEWGYTYGKTITDKSGTSMIVANFESIGSAVSRKEVSLHNGTLLINAMGDVSYL